MKTEIHGRDHRPRAGRRSPLRGPRKSLDFAAVNRAILPQLPSLLREWLPGGQVRGREYVALNPLRDDRQLGSFRINLHTARWADFAVEDARGGDPISLVAYLNDISQFEAALRLARLLEATDG